MTWLKALQLGLQILAAVKDVQAGQPATLTLEWKGKTYTLTLTQQ